MTLKIGALAERTRTNAPTIRYYEAIGLLPPAGRRSGGQRSYDEKDVRRLTFIRRCRELALPIKQVQQLVSLWQNGGTSCHEAREVVQQHVDDVRTKLVGLKALKRALEGLLERCDNSGADCAALQDLTQPEDQAGSKRRRARRGRATPS